tara:strand:+ start:5994 stop:7025 length:1032 start_codon:yes stop_codon:yes gene_type:complete
MATIGVKKEEDLNEREEDSVEAAIAAAIAEEEVEEEGVEVVEEPFTIEEPEETETEIEVEVETEAKTEVEPEKVVEDTTAIAAPQSWDVNSKLDWDKIPKNIQVQIDKRERETATALSGSGQARNFAAQFSQLMQPYSDDIQATGQHPLQAISSVLAVSQGLLRGSPEEKASIVTGLIQQYGIDVKAVDDMLVGKRQPMQQMNNRQQRAPVDPATQQRLNQLEQEVQVQRNRESQVVGQQTQGFLDKTPFANELRMEMADLIDAADARGQPIDLQKAYEMAAAFHPEIQKRLQAQQNKSKMKGKKRAASSMKQQAKVSGPKGRNKAGSVDDDIAAAIEELENS